MTIEIGSNGIFSPKNIGRRFPPHRFQTEILDEYFDARIEAWRNQHAFFHSRKRFCVVPAGRRSGKTAIAKRKSIVRAVYGPSDSWIVWGAPTHAQAKRIFWRDLKKMTLPFRYPGERSLSEGELTVRLVNGTEITVMGLDEPARIEGRPLDGFLGDEWGNVKPVAWEEHISPGLDDPSRPRPGWAFFTGVPEGRNHYYKLAKFAQTERGAIDHGYYHWKSWGVLPPDVILAAKRRMDPRTFDQEYGAAFVDFAGRVYYRFDRERNVSAWCKYRPDLPLDFSFDFNVEPGVAVVSQVQHYDGDRTDIPKGREIVAVLGEVWIPSDSDTPTVCRKLIEDWTHHKGLVRCFGDATGGARGTAKTEGSDWQLIRKYLGKRWKPGGPRLDSMGRKRGESGQLRFFVKKENPRERVRVNSVNSLCRNADEEVRLLIHPDAIHLIEDFEGVRVKEGSAGEIEKRKDPELTHISDAIGYMIERKFPIIETETSQHAA